jgi:hypothetical protein
LEAEEAHKMGMEALKQDAERQAGSKGLKRKWQGEGCHGLLRRV